MNIPRKLWKSFVFFLLSLSFLEINAQNKSVTGTVTDTNNEALIGVTIQVQGTTKGTVTDYDGKYMIPDVPGDAKISVSYIGMQSQVIDVNNRSVIDIVLREDAELLEEVVQVGNLPGRPAVYRRTSHGYCRQR